MGMNITEKILARASGKNIVSPDDVVIANIDKVMMHDVSGPGVIKVFSEWEKKGINSDHVWDPDRVWISEDHFVPASDKYLLIIFHFYLTGRRNTILKNTINMV